MFRTVFALCMLCGAGRAAAQYYSWGADAPMKWSSVRTGDVRVLFPDTAAGPAARTLRYVEAVRPDIGYGFRLPPLKIPFVLHPSNAASNGLVMWMPKRIEFLSAPSIESYAMPWLKQLAAHEYRHAVQYNNLDRGVVRVASRLLGQQGAVAGLLFMPLWAIEGDAVMAETAASSFGRGLQPSFTIGYRAMGRVDDGRRNVDKWFCGSFRDYVPDHYELGYQLCAYAYDRYGEVVWDKVGRFGVRNPYMFATTRIALRKYYGTDVPSLFRETFADLERHWASLPEPEERAATLTELPGRNHTTYRWPLPLGDTVVVALRTDYDRPSRFVAIDRRTGRERVIAHTGEVSTRPTLAGERLYWTEYRRSALFNEKVVSRLCCMELAEGRPRTCDVSDALYPEALPDGLAWVVYRPDGSYLICRRCGDATETVAVPCGAEIHGLAWDDATAALYALVTDDDGMWLARVDAGGLRQVSEPAYITLSDLRAADGTLYYGSIASGRDEIHCYDLDEGREYRLTASRYGAFAPMPAGGDLLMTLCDSLGYRVAVQPADAQRIPVEPSKLPVNLVNPARRIWPSVNLDTVRFTPADSAAMAERLPAKRYRKGLSLWKLHSWAPVSFDPFELVEEHDGRVNVGATLLSQNLLSSAEGYLSYGWNSKEGSLLHAGFRYSGLGAVFSAYATYGGDRLVYALAQRNPDSDGWEMQPLPAATRYGSFEAVATLPFYFQRGYHTRRLSVSAHWNWSNGMVADVRSLRYDPNTGLAANLADIGYNKGVNKFTLGVGFYDVVRLAHRDFLPRKGYLLQADWSTDPLNRDFSDLVAFYGKLYAPGVAAHHVVTVAAAWQTSFGGYLMPGGSRFLSYKSTRLLPRGCTSADIRSDRYLAGSVDYQLPLCYPDGGVSGVLYVKRIRLNVGGDYAQFRTAAGGTRRLWSCGGDVTFDVNVLRLPAAATSSVTLSFYKPNVRGWWFTAGVGLPF